MIHTRSTVPELLPEQLAQPRGLDTTRSSFSSRLSRSSALTSHTPAGVRRKAELSGRVASGFSPALIASAMTII